MQSVQISAYRCTGSARRASCAGSHHGCGPGVWAGKPAFRDVALFQPDCDVRCDRGQETCRCAVMAPPACGQAAMRHMRMCSLRLSALLRQEHAQKHGLGCHVAVSSALCKGAWARRLCFLARCASGCFEHRWGPTHQGMLMRSLSTSLCACAGKQAEVLNIVLTEVLEGHPVRDVKLKEVLGHTPLQVQPHKQCS